MIHFMIKGVFCVIWLIQLEKLIIAKTPPVHLLFWKLIRKQVNIT